MLAQNCLAPDWFPTTVPSARENPVVGFSVPGAFFPFRECLQNCWMNRYGLLRCFSLARTHHSVHDGARDVHCALSKIDVSPLQIRTARSVAARWRRPGALAFAHVTPSHV